MMILYNNYNKIQYMMNKFKKQNNIKNLILKMMKNINFFKIYQINKNTHKQLYNKDNKNFNNY